MKTAVIYARYSSERQTEQSIEGQLRVCREYAERNDIVVLDEYIDRATTGTNDNRDAFQRLLKHSDKKIWDYVLVYKLDRFSRNKYEMAIHRRTLKDNGIKLLSAMENIPDSPEGIILESLLEGMAEYYSAELSQKVKRGLTESRLKGQFTGGTVLYGYYVDNKKVCIDSDEAEIVRFIYSQYANDVFVKDIISDLNKKGILYRGKPFARTTVYNILHNIKYSGAAKFGDEIYKNIYPQIVSENIFNIVRNKALENHFGKHNANVQYLLKNKITCGICGGSISSETGTARDGSVKRYYKCQGRKNQHACHKQTVRKDILEKLVIDVTLKIFSSNQTLSFIADKILDAQAKKFADESVVNILTKQIQETQKAIENLVSAIEKGIITSSTKTRLESLEQQLTEMQEKLLLEKSRKRTRTTKKDIINFIKLTIKKDPKPMLKQLIKQIVLYDDKIEIYYNYIDIKRPDEDDHQAFLFYDEKSCIDYSYERYNINTNDYYMYQVNTKMLIKLYI